jgi:hypothetical protein
MASNQPNQREALFRVNQASEVEVQPHATGCTLRWSDSRVLSGILTNLPFILVAVPFILFGLGATLVGAASMVMQDESDPCAFVGGASLVLGDGTLYCEEEPSITKLTSFEEDGQHFQVTKSDGELRQFRWSEERQYLVVGIYEQALGSSGFYICSVHLDATSLRENWTVDDLVDPYAYNLLPEWCYQEFGSEEQEGNFSPAGVSPFENTTLWMVESDDAGFFCGVRFDLDSIEETCYVQPYDEGIIVLLFPLFFAGVGLYMLSFSDDRRHQLTFHTPSQSLRWRKSYGGSRWTGSTWNRVDFASLQVVNSKNILHLPHEGSSSHHGRHLQINVGGEGLPLLFIAGEQHDQVALDAIVAQLESSLGVPVQRLDDPIQFVDDGLSPGDDFDEESELSGDYISREALLAAIHSTMDGQGSPSTESSSENAPDIHPESSPSNIGQSVRDANGLNDSFWGGLDGENGRGK